MKKRRYTLRQRAESQEETRRRIVDAAMHLHEELGPRATSISAIAERAGVQRLTVYRHFPDEMAVFQACTSHWQSLNPPPDSTAWAEIADPLVRAEAALLAFYRYYRGAERMLEVSYRDEADVPALHEPMKAFRSYVSKIANGVLKSFVGEPQRALRATVHHAFAFSTWASLKRLGIDDEAMAALTLRWIEGAAKKRA
jgi:AcrR family transcriptional regulator